MRSAAVDARTGRSYPASGEQRRRRVVEEDSNGVTAGEFAFLAVGLLLGVASGAAFVIVARSHAPAGREVRLTMTPDSVPRRRAATLSTDTFATAPAEPARGGPADRRWQDRQPAEPLPADRTIVRPAASASLNPAVGIPIRFEPDPALSALRATAAVAAEAAIREQGLTATAVLERAAVRRAAAARLAEPGDDGFKPPVGRETGAGGSGGSGGSGGPGGSGSSSLPPPVATGQAAIRPAPAEPTGSPACADAHRQADERCAVADRARGVSVAAGDALRSLQRTYDELRQSEAEAEEAADPRRIRAEKERAQATFRVARSAAATTDAVEAAARDWLGEINRVNAAAREAAARLGEARARAADLVVRIERLTAEADASRIAAETAEAACYEARDAAARCEELEAARRAGGPVEPTAEAFAAAASAAEAEARGDEPLLASGSSSQAAIFRLVRGDHGTLIELVAELGGEDPAARRMWQIALSGLVDAVLQRAIEACALEFPVDHPFWGPFTRSQNREIASALASLGYRFDGLGGWTDGRIPSQRDLSLAVGYAGLDPMRVRRWPSEAETAELYRAVTVSGDEYLAGAGGGLTLGEIVSALGRRADELTDLWNNWARVRPLLLAA